MTEDIELTDFVNIEIEIPPREGEEGPVAVPTTTTTVETIKDPVEEDVQSSKNLPTRRVKAGPPCSLSNESSEESEKENKRRHRTHKRKQPPIYTDSGSDFEEEMKKERKAKRTKKGKIVNNKKG